MAKKYIDAEKLKTEIERLESEIKSQIAELGNFESNEIGLFNYLDLYDDILSIITSLQQEQPESICPRCVYRNKMDDICEYPYGGRKCRINENGVYECNGFEEVEQQEQPNDIRTEIEEYYGEDLALEDERTKAAYHFFSAGKAFELREYEEEREKHITDLLDNFQKGMNAGYEKAISELKEGKVECSPVMKELIDKLFGIGNTFNFGFGPKNIQQEQPEVDLKNEIITQWSKCNPTDEGMGSEYAIIAVEQFDAIARYFCELGRKQVLQEIYYGKIKPVDKITAAWLDDK